MKVELHCHTSRYSACAVNSPAEVMTRLTETGYQAVFITEHDAVWTDRGIAELQADFPRIRVFPGIELSIGADSVQHLLVLGTTDPAYLGCADEAVVLEKARSEGCLTVLSHPFRWEGGADILENGPLPDALEYRTCNHGSLASDGALAWAERLKIPLVNAGDVHSLEFVNRFWIETASPVERAGDIRAAVLGRAYENRAGSER